jgi:uncharacterized ferritin-like protein (DUF455 family)
LISLIVAASSKRTGLFLFIFPNRCYLGLMNFEPFIVCQPGQRIPKPRPMESPGGLADRMRTAAFAEKQAILAFTWAIGRFQDVPQALRDDWARLVPEEEKHYHLIVDRMAELGFSLTEKPVSTRLWESLEECETGKEFCLRISGAEERGRQAGVLLVEYLKDKDPVTAAIFEEIVTDEVAHVQLADKYFGWKP